MKKICIIPARMAASRLPGKPLANINGLPLIIHIAKRCLLTKNIDYLAVATCDEEIISTCKEYGINSIMTSNSHERCTDRVSEAVSKLDFEVKNDDLVVMVQGDEILVTPELIKSIIVDYTNNKAPVTNLVSKIYQESDHIDPNVVKVVFDPNNQALYFSRAPIPSTFKSSCQNLYQQTGIIGFSREFLDHFNELPQTYLEKIESIDMLRVLENRLPLRVVCTDDFNLGVDTPADLERAAKLLEKDILTKEYC